MSAKHPAPPAGPRRCRVCGCTDQDACVLLSEDSTTIQATCTWTEADLCDACEPDASPRWVHPGELDHPGRRHR